MWHLVSSELIPGPLRTPCVLDTWGQIEVSTVIWDKQTGHGQSFDKYPLSLHRFIPDSDPGTLEAPRSLEGRLIITTLRSLSFGIRWISKFQTLCWLLDLCLLCYLSLHFLICHTGRLPHGLCVKCCFCRKYIENAQCPVLYDRLVLIKGSHYLVSMNWARGGEVQVSQVLTPDHTYTGNPEALTGYSDETGIQVRRASTVCFAWRNRV